MDWNEAGNGEPLYYVINEEDSTLGLALVSVNWAKSLVDSIQIFALT